MGNGQWAIGNGQEAIGNKQWAVGDESTEFKIFCGNKDLDGSILQDVAFDEWVPYNAHTKVWYSSSGNILPVLQQAIKKEISVSFTQSLISLVISDEA